MDVAHLAWNMTLFFICPRLYLQLYFLQSPAFCDQQLPHQLDIQLLVIFFLFIECIVVTLIDKIIQVSEAQFYKTSSALCIVLLPEIKSMSNPIKFLNIVNNSKLSHINPTTQQHFPLSLSQRQWMILSYHFRSKLKYYFFREVFIDSYIKWLSPSFMLLLLFTQHCCNHEWQWFFAILFFFHYKFNDSDFYCPLLYS